MYKIIFKGEVAQETDISQVKQQFAQLLNIPINGIESFFSGRPMPLKKSQDYNALCSIKATYEQIGLICSIEEVDPHSSAFHEACHAVYYLIACAKEGCVPKLHEISMIPDSANDNHGHISREELVSENDFINNPAQHKNKIFLWKTMEEMKIRLAGLASSPELLEAENRIDPGTFFQTHFVPECDKELATVANYAKIFTKYILQDYGKAHALLNELFVLLTKDLRKNYQYIKQLVNLILTHKEIVIDTPGKQIT